MEPRASLCGSWRNIKPGARPLSKPSSRSFSERSAFRPRLRQGPRQRFEIARIAVSPLVLAERVIRGASREHPADSVLRLELKSQHRLGTHEAAQTSRAVFAYYRWHGWLNHRRPIREQISHALELANQFASNPLTFLEPELVEKAVPGWLKDQMELTPAWVRSIQSEPKLWLRAKREQGRELARKLGDCRVLGEEQQIGRASCRERVYGR